MIKAPKLIVALDFNDQNKALELINRLSPGDCSLKVGNEMFTRFGPSLIAVLRNKGFNVFLDLKYHDIPNTVSQACRAAADLGVWMVNVHASGGSEMIAAARNALELYGNKRPLLTAVTVLTSMSATHLSEIGIVDEIDNQVSRLAVIAANGGADGIVCSALEVPNIKKCCGEKFITVTPGIRLPENSVDDQSRIVTPQRAFLLGSDFIVVGRPITGAKDPQLVIKSFVF